MSDVTLLPLPSRAGDLTIAKLIDLYMAHYAGRDMTRLTRLTWWSERIGPMALQDLSDDEVHAALEHLSNQQARYYAGKDADGSRIYKLRPRRTPLAPATINRYGASLASVITWAINRRIAPKGFVHPCRTIERRAENNERVRFLSDEERDALLTACRASPWQRLYLLVLMALTTGARKGELVGLRWRDFQGTMATVGRTKNGDPRVLPLVPAVMEELKRFQSTDAQLVFRSTRRPDQAYDFGPRWQAAMDVAGVKKFRFHDLRHSCASMLAQNGATLLEIGDLLGHRQLQMTKRYSHLATGHKEALVNRVLGGIK